jgi:DNA repair exonuclease SbcCD nuclease subunit
MAKLLVVNDVHVADRPPLGRVDSYCEDILAKLVEVKERAAELDVDAVLFTGDIFHVKRAPHVSHSLVQRLIALFRTFPCPVYVLPGNHDLSEEGLASLSRQPLGVLIKAGVMTPLGIDYRTIVEAGPGVFLVARPFDAARDADADYYALTAEERAYLSKQGPCLTILVTHGSIVPPGEVRPYPSVAADFIDFKGIDLLLGSHIHEHMGVCEVSKGYFANLGSLGRIARTADSMTREVVCLLVTVKDAGGLEFEEVPITSARPAAEVFLAMADGEDVDVFGAEGFADHIMAALDVEEMSVADLIATYAADLPDGVKRRLEHYLGNAGL